jgi:hypothetical protein
VVVVRTANPRFHSHRKSLDPTSQKFETDVAKARELTGGRGPGPRLALPRASTFDAIREENALAKRLLSLSLMALVACVVAATGVAAGSTQVEQFSEGPFPDNICGVSGMTTVHGTSVFRETGEGTFFASGTFWAVFTAENGKSITVFAAGPVTRTAPPVIDEEAGTVTLVTTFRGLPEKLSITHGRTLSLDAGTATFVSVFEYTGDPDEPLGDLISQDISFLAGPHPDVLSDFEIFCDVLEPYLLDP